MDDSGARQAWAAAAIARRWPRAGVAQIAALRGDLSTRRFWRVAIATRGESAPASAILVDLGPDDLPRYVRVLNLLPSPITEPPWINVHRFLESIGSPVPALYDADPARRAMLVEDVGQLSLLDAVRRPGADAADLFRLAASELLRIHVDGTSRIDSRCIAHEISYSGRLFEWELKEFGEVGLAAVAPGADYSPVAPEIATLRSATRSRSACAVASRLPPRKPIHAEWTADSDNRFSGCAHGARSAGPRRAHDDARHR